MFGSYVGEVFRKNHGAVWGMVNMQGQESPGMQSEGSAGLFWPWGKVQNRIVNGSEDNLWHYYEALIRNNGDGPLQISSADSSNKKPFWKKLFGS